MLPVGVPDLLQEGDGFGAADGAQADRPAGGWREEASEVVIGNGTEKMCTRIILAV